MFEIGQMARLSKCALENMPPIAYPKLRAAVGQVVTIVDWSEPNSDPGVYEVVTADGTTLYPLPSELEKVSELITCPNCDTENDVPDTHDRNNPWWCLYCSFDILHGEVIE